MEVLKSSCDLKQYKLLTLDNGLEVLLVSTEGCKSISMKAAAAVSVQVGSFADPVSMQGLAHFVEHMVFMGSSAYPVENHYDAFVHSHGGDCNAMTEGEHTVFQFNISKDHFGPGLDIFANCLLNPLLNADAMERELQAIESEFSLALSDDGARLQQLLGMSSSSDHVLRKFSWGNEYSLKTVPEQHKVDAHHMIRRFHATHYTPNRMKLVMVADCSLADLEGHLMSSAFSHALDGSSRIDPALLLPQQEMMLSPFNLPLPVSSFQKLYRVIPTRKTHKLLLSWQLHSSLTSYKSKSVGYLGHLIGHEGEGSLLSELKRLEYSSSVSAGVSEGNMDNNTMFSVFNITVNLSSKGLANWFTVANVVFVYLHSLKEAGPQEWVYEELRQMADLSFTYLEEEEEEELAERLSMEMLPYFSRDRCDLLRARYMHSHYNPDEITRLTNILLDPFQVRVELLSSSFHVHDHIEPDGADPETEWEDDDDEDMDDDDTASDDASGGDDDDDDDDDYDDEDSEMNVGASDEGDDGSHTETDITPEQLLAMYKGPQHLEYLVTLPTKESGGGKKVPKVTPEVETYFGTIYWVDAIPMELLDEWKSPLKCVRLHLPPRNTFIPKDFRIIATSETNANQRESEGSVFNIGQQLPTPSKLMQVDGLTVWHLMDPMHSLPKVEIIMSFASCAPYASPLNAAMNDLYVRVVQDSLVETAYMAAMAELHSSLSSTDIGSTIEISGFSDKALVLLGCMIDNLIQPKRIITAARVDRQTELLLRSYENENMKAAKSAANCRLCALKPTKISADRKLIALRTIMEDTSRVFEELLSYCLSFLSSVVCELLVVGNIAPESAVKFSDDVLDRFKASRVNISASHRPTQRIVNISSPRPLVLHAVPNNLKEKNTCIEAYCQLGQHNLRSLTMLDLLDQVVAEQFFDDLRTRQQLGYNVGCGVRQTYGVLAFCFTVVSSSHSAGELLTAISKFAVACPKWIGSLPDEEFLSHIGALREHFLQPHSSMAQVAKDAWFEIEERRYTFNHGAMQAALVSSVTKQELSDFAFKLLCSERKLLVATSSVEDRLEDSMSDEVKAAFHFVSKPEEIHSMPLYESNV